MRSLPSNLLAEIRHAFQSCSKQYAASRRTHFSTVSPRLKASRPAKNEKDLPIQVVHNRLQNKKKHHVTSRSESRELIPQKEEDKSLGSRRKVEVPLKVIPEANIAPGLTLSPKERLHIEQLTRALPPREEPKSSLALSRIMNDG